MKKTKFKKIIASTLIVVSVLVLNPIVASATGATVIATKCNQWIQVFGTWRYNDATGNPITNSWLYDKKLGKYYYVQDDGDMATGWLKTNGAYYYFNSDGSMATNTTISGYAVGANGAWVGTTPSSTINPIIINNVDNTQNLNSTTNTVKSITTIYDLESYLNQNYASLETPIGTLKFSFSIDENDDKMLPYDLWIKTDYGDIENSKYNLANFEPYDLENSIKISDNDKEKTIELLKKFQKNVAQEAMKYFPDKKIEGGFYNSCYKYAYLQVGLESNQFLSWNNYYEEDEEENYDLNEYGRSHLSDFEWTEKYDDYKF